MHLSREGWIYISDSERKALYRVRMGAGREPEGLIELVIDKLPGIDDFTLAPHGAVIVATHQHEIMRLGTDRSLSILTKDDAVAGATAVVAGRGPSAGSFFVTGKGEAVLSRLRLP